MDLPDGYVVDSQLSTIIHPHPHGMMHGSPPIPGLFPAKSGYQDEDQAECQHDCTTGDRQCQGSTQQFRYGTDRQRADWPEPQPRLPGIRDSN